MKIIASLTIIACILSSYSTITTAEFSHFSQDPDPIEELEINEPAISLEENSLKVLVTSAAECASASSAIMNNSIQN
jgi:hypothetical protein